MMQFTITPGGEVTAVFSLEEFQNIILPAISAHNEASAEPEVYERIVGSFSGSGTYTVRCTTIDEDDIWNCTCPDFTYRHGGLRGECKHIASERFSRWTERRGG